MRPPRTPTWSRLRVDFGLLRLALLVLGGLLVYASSLAAPTIGDRRASLGTLGIELMALAVIAGALARALDKHLWRD